MDPLAPENWRTKAAGERWPRRASRRQVQPGRPALGTLDERGQVGLAELDAGEGAHDRARLGRGEAQVVRPELGQFAGRAPACQRQRRIGPRHEHDLHRCGEMVQQERHLLVAARLGDRMVIVQHQDGWYREARQLVDQAGDRCSRDVGGAAPQMAQDLFGIELRARPQQRVRDVPPQLPWLIVILVERDPCERPSLHRVGAPLGREDGLAVTCRSLDEDELGLGSRQSLNECGPLDPPPGGDRAQAAPGPRWSSGGSPGEILAHRSTMGRTTHPGTGTKVPRRDERSSLSPVPGGARRRPR